MTATIAILKDKLYYDKEEVKQLKTKKGRKDIEDYHSENGKSLGFSYGTGSDVLKLLDEPIKAGYLNKLTSGINPINGEIIFKKIKPYKNKKGTLQKDGYDLCFSAVKDFSILAELDEENKEKYELGFLRATKRALDVVNQKIYRRLNSKGKKSFDVKPIELCYIHKTARPIKDLRPDMQWHSHNIILNKCFNQENEIKSIESYPLFNFQKLYGATFRAELANVMREMNFEIIPAKEIVEESLMNGGTKSVKVNSFKVKGITDEQRNKFSNRSIEINKAAKPGATSLDKRNIAQEIKRDKVVWEEDKLKAIWKQDGESVGITKEFIQQLKQNKPIISIVEQFKLDETIIKQSLTKFTDKETKEVKFVLFEAKLRLRLIEDEQISGINADQRFENMEATGLIKRDKGFIFTHTVDLTKEYLKTKSFKRNIKYDFKNASSKVILYKSLLTKNTHSFSQIAFMSVIEMSDITPKKKVIENVSIINKEDNNTNTFKAVSFSLCNSIAEIEIELNKHGLTVEERYKLLVKLNNLQSQQEKERLSIINSRFKP